MCLSSGLYTRFFSVLFVCLFEAQRLRKGERILLWLSHNQTVCFEDLFKNKSAVPWAIWTPTLVVTEKERNLPTIISLLLLAALDSLGRHSQEKSLQSRCRMDELPPEKSILCGEDLSPVFSGLFLFEAGKSNEVSKLHLISKLW